MSKVVTIQRKGLHTLVQWRTGRKVTQTLRFYGPFPERWKPLLERDGYTIQAAPEQAA